MPKIWFTSDTHFSSERTLEFSKRPFGNINEMNETLIKNWNDLVSPDDIVYHLGDIGDLESFKQLNGNITIIIGNYDKDENIIPKLKDSEKVIEIVPYKKLTIDNVNYLLIHEPFQAIEHFQELIDKDYFILFGHIHKLQMVKEIGLNVGTDCHNFKPIDIDTIQFYRTAIKEHYDINVFC